MSTDYEYLEGVLGRIDAAMAAPECHGFICGLRVGSAELGDSLRWAPATAGASDLNHGGQIAGHGQPCKSARRSGAHARGRRGLTSNEWFGHILGVDLDLEADAAAGAPAEPVDALDVVRAEGALREFIDELWAGLDGTLTEGDFDFTLMLPSDEAPLSVRTDSLAQWCSGFLLGVGMAGALDVDKLSSEGSEALRDISEISRVVPDGTNDADAEQAFMELVEYVRVAVLLIWEENQWVRGNHTVPPEMKNRLH